MKLVSELSGALLDYWVARANGYQPDLTRMKVGDGWCAIEARSANVADPDPNADPRDIACDIGMVPNAIREFPACILGYKVGRAANTLRVPAGSIPRPCGGMAVRFSSGSRSD